MPFSKPYPALRDFIDNPTPRDVMVQQACEAIDQQVRAQKGMLGATLKAVYRMAKSLAPRQVEQLVSHFFEPFLDAMTPHYHQALEENQNVVEHFEAHAAEVADSLLAVTDAYTAKDKDGPLKSAYGKLRHRAVDRLEGSMGALGELVQRNLTEPWRPGAA